MRCCFVTLFFLLFSLLPQVSAREPGTYTLVVSGYDWGPAANKVVLHLDRTPETVDPGDFSVAVERSMPDGVLPPELAHGSREVVHAYFSDRSGNPQASSRHLTLVLYVAPNRPLGSPMHYLGESGKGNVWLDYDLTITRTGTGEQWSREVDRIHPIVDGFHLDGVFEHENAIRLTYAWFEPELPPSGKAPLLIWLHGGGEGGTDPTIPLLANRAANYASPEIQAIFEGAYVLVPQTPTRWMHGISGDVTWGQEDDIYHRALIALFRDFLEQHPGIDPDRIYVGGCSNGGYMSLKLLLENPDYFAAAYISALAFRSESLSDEQVERIRHLPIWFVHSADDRVTPPGETVLPIYQRLREAGANRVHLSYYDHVIDITGFFGGKGYRYNGHFSWIYHHANRCRRDYDGSLVRIQGRPVTLMEWLAAQSR